MQNQLPVSESSTSSDFNLKEQILNYLQYWKWFVLSVLICLSIAVLYLRYYVVEYGASTSVLIKDEKKGGSSEFSAFGDINIFSSKNNVDNEIAIIKSRSLSQNVVRSLDLDWSYFSEGRVVNMDLYKDSPVKVVFLKKSEDYDAISKAFTISILSKNSFAISDSENKNSKKYSFGQKIHDDLGDYIIVRNSNVAMVSPSDVLVVKSNLEGKSNAFRSKLVILSLEKTNVLTLSTTDQVAERGLDYLDEVVSAYNQDAIRDRNQVANFTKEFINKRLQIITEELGGVESQEETFKKVRGLTTLEADSEVSLSEATSYNKQVLDMETELKVNQFMLDETNKVAGDGLLPSDISSSNGLAAIAEYNSLVLEKRRYLKSAKESNPKIQNLNNHLASLKANIIETILNRQKDLRINLKKLVGESGRYHGKVANVPTNDRYYKEIARQQQIKESLYLYLLQKREETELSLAATSPKAKIIDQAYLTGPVSLKRSVFYLAALVLGLLIPFGIIFLIDFFDTKIKYRQDVEGKVSIPFLGDLPKSTSNEEIIKSNSRSSSAEAIRMIRTNLEFILAHVPENKCKTIFVTSSIPKEGKTFCAINLATTIALSGKKVLIIGLDIRNPKLDQYIDLPTKGLTNYLSKANDDINDYIVKVKDFTNFFALPSGVIPPNPVELLMNDKLNLMFDALKQQYDYIIVDTAPVSVVTDTFLIAKNADSFVYVMRANYVDKRMLKFVESLYTEHRLPNMAVLLNDTDTKKGYGYGYGYGYGVDEVPMTTFEKLKSFFTKKE